MLRDLHQSQQQAGLHITEFRLYLYPFYLVWAIPSLFFSNLFFSNKVGDIETKWFIGRSKVALTPEVQGSNIWHTSLALLCQCHSL